MPRLNRQLLKYEIEEAQKNSLSANAAARYLGVDRKIKEIKLRKTKSKW